MSHLAIKQRRVRLDQRTVGLAASRRCSRSSACSTRRRDGEYRSTAAVAAKLDPSRSARAIRNRQIGFIFQAFNLIGDLTVYENVELPLTYRGMPAAERKKRVARGARARSACRTA